uniref:RNA-binding protein EEED8.10 n=1 Tax=Caenorhabditis japonica TaxID=281687 RepID=A0A8R1DP27_CAEJA
MFKALRRLHGQNLESRGLHDITEAFQSFVTRARFFSIGKLRRTWSHSAAEFMKYRRLLPMLLADGEAFDGGETDDFDASIAFQHTSRDDRKIVVSNISPRVTQSQLQSFFSQYGKITSCILPREEKKTSVFGTLPKHSKNCGTATITFKKAEHAERAKNASSEELKFYDQVMVVSAYVSKKRGGKGLVLSDDFSREETPLSRASSTQSLASGSAAEQVFQLNAIPDRVLRRVISFLPVHETVRVERVNKKWMEESIKSWELVNRLVLARETRFNKQRPMRTSHLKTILTRAGQHLRSFDLSGIVHLFDDRRSLKVIATCCPNLVELDISGTHAHAEALEELGESLTKLESLSYRGMATTGDKAFYFLLKNCGHSLKFVDLRNAKRMHGRAFKLFGSQLEGLYLDGSSKVDELAFEDLCTSCGGLKELRLNECYRITDENLSMIARRMADLSILTLCGDGFKYLTAAGLIHISHMHNITELALDYNTLVNDELLISISAGLPNLSSLSLANAGDDSSITSVGVAAIKNLHELTQLDISSLAAVNSSVMAELAVLVKLEIVQLRNCTYLGDDGVRVMLKMPNLRHVDLSGSMLVSNDSIQEFIKAFPNGPKLPPTTLVVGGTAADASKLSVRGSRVVVDFSDYSTIVTMQTSQSSGGNSSKLAIGGSLSDNSDGESEDNDFEALTAQRSFYIDAVCGEEESPITDDGKLAEWAEKEARSLGLLID